MFYVAKSNNNKKISCCLAIVVAVVLIKPCFDYALQTMLCVIKFMCSFLKEISNKTYRKKNFLDLFD